MTNSKPISPTVSFSYTTSDNTIPVESSELPPIHLSEIRDSSILLHEAWVDHQNKVVLACVRGPSHFWAPGVEDIIFDRATQIAREHFAPVPYFEFGPSHFNNRQWSAQAHGFDDSPVRHVKIHHHLAISEDNNAYLCSIACESTDPHKCDERIEHAHFSGALAPSPTSSIVMLSLAQIAKHPRVFMALGSALVAITCIILWIKRPRPRW